MPTGYTAPIEDNANFTFEDYIWRCAKAHLMEYRDKGMNEPVKLEDSTFNDNGYHQKELKEAFQKRKDFNTLTDAELKELYKQNMYDRLDKAEEALKKALEMKVRYDSFLEQAKAWEPPTDKHENLKKFMIDQIEQSTAYNDVEYYKNQLIEIGQQSFEDYIKVEKDSLEWHVSYHTEQMGKSIKRDNGRTEWVRALIDKHGEDRCQKP